MLATPARALRLVLLAIILFAPAQAGLPAMDVMAYYLLLPVEHFACDAPAFQDSPAFREGLLVHRNVRQGYLRARLPVGFPLEVALFRNRQDGIDIVALAVQCGPGCMCNLLAFLVLDRDTGEWDNITTSLLPTGVDITEAIGIDPAELHFTLPERGTTILGRQRPDGPVVVEIPWDGRRFGVRPAANR